MICSRRTFLEGCGGGADTSIPVMKCGDVGVESTDAMINLRYLGKLRVEQGRDLGVQ